ncbi:MAG: chemotaxis protein CheW, partial [Phycisphaerae bacterium]|nr:chemotaxis protein CheW [Phycisphaerae bacterium]
ALASERYAVESTSVREVFPIKDLTPLPCAPSFVLGIINVRGQILPVIDLRRFFDLPIKGLTELNKVIILQSSQIQLGLLADAVLGVRRVPLADIQSALPTLDGVRSEFLRGITRDRMVILDAPLLLADERIVINEEVQG